jgi:hypothetical protein
VCLETEPAPASCSEFELQSGLLQQMSDGGAQDPMGGFTQWAGGGL